MEYILEEKYQKKISKDLMESEKALHKYFANAWDQKFLQYLNEKLQHQLKYMVEAHEINIENKAEFSDLNMYDVVDYVENESSQAKGVKDESK